MESLGCCCMCPSVKWSRREMAQFHLQQEVSWCGLKFIWIWQNQQSHAKHSWDASGGGAPCGKSVYQRHMGLTGINEHCSCNGKNTECGKGGIGVGEIYGHFDEQVGITEIVHQFFFSYSYNLLTTWEGHILQSQTIPFFDWPTQFGEKKCS